MSQALIWFFRTAMLTVFPPGATTNDKTLWTVKAFLPYGRTLKTGMQDISWTMSHCQNSIAFTAPNSMLCHTIPMRLHSVSLSLPFRACEAVIQYELENRRTCSPFHALERGDAVVLLVVDNTLMCSVLPAFVLHKRARTISFCLYAYALSYAYYVHVFAFMQEKRWLCLRLLPSRFNFR